MQNPAMCGKAARLLVFTLFPAHAGFKVTKHSKLKHLEIFENVEITNSTLNSVFANLREKTAQIYFHAKRIQQNLFLARFAENFASFA